MPSISVYAEKIIAAEPPQRGDLVFTRIHAAEALAAIDPDISIQTVYERGGIALYQYGD